MEISVIVEKGLYVLLGVLVTAITNHFLSKSREHQIHRIISFNTAADKFRHSFDDALLHIDQGDKAVSDILKWQYMSHKVAMWHFKYCFTGKARMRFEKTWDEYEKYYQDNSEKDPRLPSDISRAEYRVIIEKLIKYTTGWERSILGLRVRSTHLTTMFILR